MSSRGAWDAPAREAFLLTCPPFCGLAPATTHLLAARLHPRYVRRGDFVFLAGEAAVALSLLAAGRIKIVGDAGAGHEVALRLLGPGALFGGAGVWGEAVYPASAVALRDAVVLQTLTRDFAALLGEHPDLCLAVIRELGRRLRSAEARIRDLQTESVERRLARAVLRLAQEMQREGTGPAHGIGRDQTLELPTPLSRRDLASLAGTTVSTASRTLRAWHGRGIVVAGRERVAVRQPHALAALAGGPGTPTADGGADCAGAKSATVGTVI